MSDLVVIDNGQARDPRDEDGPFYVWRRLSDGYVGVSRVPMEREGIEPIEVLPRWRQARAWVLVERWGFPIDEAVSYTARWERFEADSPRNVVAENRTRVAGAVLKGQLRVLFEEGPYDGAAVNSRGEISLSGRTRADGDRPALIWSVVFRPNRG
ncbi:hypothetical protein ACIRPQ_28940 [Streptomyces sp. NPDC101213]|uniref:hypothetical protein n=1 Tax=Streptomyces sp. NPDC101213 TaxID=3366130 RepID=UPI0037FA48B4